jgi:hypothetical protein
MALASGGLGSERDLGFQIPMGMFWPVGARGWHRMQRLDPEKHSLSGSSPFLFEWI